ncbi:Rpp14/Pop5 family protein [Natronocalculus amylovorans]|uniref:Ribonuclease P protein component 2 n=1 Tax=Natronocalculus amylovorans TaxID=2917812 RepID=A0AAE3K8R8_9EURY|nr:Rpp14/Pop5 family protein [Natronocalculus amylovorans]MCL9817602.1 ribonuclease P [Natronocalculus amylovorans]
MKHLPKHFRQRWRYIAVGIETDPDTDIRRKDLQRELWYSAGNLLGDPGSADVDLTVYSCRFEDGVGEAVIRTRREETDRARAAIACVSRVSGTAVGIHVRGISGTVRACEERYLGRAAGISEENDVAFANGRHPAYRRDGLVEIQLPSGFVGATELDIEY